MKKTLVLCSMLMVASVSPVAALTINVYESTDNISINSWIAALGGQVTVLEDFEGITVNGQMDWYQTLPTGVGTFTATGSKGTGQTSYNANNNPNSTDPYFSVQDRNGSWYGRYNTTDSGSKWLDSGDITELTLTDIDQSLTNLFFYLQDVSDAGAKTTIGVNGTPYNPVFQNKPNGASYFVGITLGAGETLSEITWLTSNQSDGYGLDGFSTVVSPIPEPATMLLFSAGLAGLAAIGRRRKV